MLLIFIISLIIYIVATIMVYHNTYNFEKQNKIKLIVVGSIITFIITVIICLISSSKINLDVNYLATARNTAILIFAPINVIVALPYIGNILNKYKEKSINENAVKKRFLILFVIVAIVIIFEIGYIKDFEIGLIKNALHPAR